MEKCRKNSLTEIDMFYHIKVLYGIVLLLLVILTGEIWIYYKKLYILENQLNTIALSHKFLISEKTLPLNSSEMHSFKLIELDETLHSRLIRNKRKILDKHSLPYRVSTLLFPFVRFLFAMMFATNRVLFNETKLSTAHIARNADMDLKIL